MSGAKLINSSNGQISLCLRNRKNAHFRCLPFAESGIFSLVWYYEKPCRLAFCVFCFRIRTSISVA